MGATSDEVREDATAGPSACRESPRQGDQPGLGGRTVRILGFVALSLAFCFLVAYVVCTWYYAARVRDQMAAKPLRNTGSIQAPGSEPTGGTRQRIESGDVYGSVSGSVLLPQGSPVCEVEVLAWSLAEMMDALESGALTARKYLTGAYVPATYRIPVGTDLTFKGDLPFGRYSIFAYAPGCAPAVLPYIGVERGSERRDLIIEFTRGRRIEGVVTDPEGCLGGATVTTFAAQWGPRPFRASTREDGTFELAELPVGEQLDLVVLHDAYGGLRVPVGQDGAGIIPLQFPRQVGFRGVLRAENQSVNVPRLLVEVLPRSPQEEWYSRREIQYQDVAGMFTALAPEGSYLIRATAEGFAPCTVPVELHPGVDAMIEFDLSYGGALVGTVATKGVGTPVSEARVVLYDRYRSAPLNESFPFFNYPPTYVAETDGEGKFSVGHAEPGLYGVLVLHPAYPRSVETSVEIRESEETVLEVHLEAGATVLGRTPWPLMDYELRHETGLARSGVSDEAGEFLVQGLLPGRYFAMCGLRDPDGPKYMPRGFLAQTEAVASTRILLSDRAAEAAEKRALFGWILDEDGLPRADVTVYAQMATARFPVLGTVQEPGYFVFPDVTRGASYAILAFDKSDSDAVRHLFSVSIGGAREGTQLDLGMGRRVVGGRVSSGEGPVADAFVTLLDWSRPGGGSGAISRRRVSSDGRFRFSGLRGGLYKVNVQAAGYAPWEEVVDLRESTDADLLLSLEVGGRISIVCIPRPGQEIQNWNIALRNEAGARVHGILKPDQEGRAVFENVGVGKYYVELYGGEGELVERREVEVQQGADAEVVFEARGRDD